MTVKQRPCELSFKVVPAPPKPLSSLIPGLLGVQAKCFIASRVQLATCPSLKGPGLGQYQHLDIMRCGLLTVITTSIITRFKKKAKGVERERER